MKKTGIVRAFLIALLSCGLVVALASCGTSYTVSYSLGEHASISAAVPESADYAQGTQIELPAAPAAQDGWEFVAWSDGSQSYEAGETYTVESDVTFTAVWETAAPVAPAEYTVTYALGEHAADDATLPAAVMVRDGAEVVLPAAPAAATGWLFAGWSDGSETYKAGAAYTVESNVTITALWNQIPTANYIVTFDLGAHAADGEEAPAAQTTPENTPITLPDGPAAATGWEFIGWSDDADGENVFEAGSQYTPVGSGLLYAQYAPIDYTVIYHLNDGDNNAANPASFNAADADITLADPSRNGYTFGGWFAEEDFSGTQVTGFASDIGRNVELWAKWTATQYDITYNLDGGTNHAGNPANYTIETPTFTLQAPTRAGYEFEGWTYDSVTTPMATVTIARGSTGERTYTANWSPISYDITYITQEGTHSNPTSYTIESGTITLGDAELTGYTFVGWYTQMDGGEPVTQIVPQETLANITLYARYTVNTVEVIFDYNYEDAPEQITLEIVFNTILGEVDGMDDILAHERSGYTIVSWNTAADGTGTVYALDKGIVDAVGLILYAQWTESVYDVTYHLDGGTIEAEEGVTYDTYTYGTGLTLPAAAKAGYNFGGWYANAEFEGDAVSEISESDTGAKEFYARWEAADFEIKLDYQYNDDVRVVTVTYGSTFASGRGWHETLERTGYVFLGWNESADGTGDSIEGTDTLDFVPDNYTLYAIWAIQVTFHANGGSMGEGETLVLNVTGGEIYAYEVEAPQYEGYRFEGWFTGAADGDEMQFPIEVTAPVTYYAHWTRVYDVTIDGKPVAELAEGEEYELETPEARDGFTFMGWTTDPEGEITYPAGGDDNSIVMQTAPVALTTVWADHSKIATEAQLRAVFDDPAADEIVLAGSITANFGMIIRNRTLTIDLGGNTLTFQSPEDSQSGVASFNIYENGDVTFKNGDLVFSGKLGTNPKSSVAAMIFVGLNADSKEEYATDEELLAKLDDDTVYSRLTLENVDVSAVATAIFLGGKAEFTMTGGSIMAEGAYALGTNASQRGGFDIYAPVKATVSGTQEDPVEIVAKGAYSDGSSEGDGAAVLVNIGQGDFKFEYVNITGPRQGMIVRAGTVTISNSAVKLLGTFVDGNSNNRLNAAWGTGNEVVQAALVVGDSSLGSYNAPATLNISDTSVTIAESATVSLEYLFVIYAYEDSDSNSATTVNGGCDYDVTVGDGSQDVTISHAYGDLIPEQPATCEKNGTKAHYECANCGKLFVLEEGNYTEVDAEDLVIPAGHTYGELVPAQEATCTADGRAAYYHCEVCDTYFTADKVETTWEDLATKPLGHAYDAIEYNARTGELSIACSRGDVTYTATVTFSGGNATGAQVLTKDDFVFVEESTSFTLTLPANSFTAPTGYYFNGWSVTTDGEDVLQPAATVTVANGASVSVVADWVAYSAEHPLVIGTADNQLAYTANSPVWTGDIHQGEIVTFTGSMTSAAVSNWQTVLMYMWSEEVVGQFRFDSWVTDATEEGNAENGNGPIYAAKEGWTITKSVAPNFAGTAFLDTIKKCSITLTYDWLDASRIYVVFQATSEYGVVQKMVYVIAPADGEFDVASYHFGLGGQESYTVLNRVLVHTEQTHDFVGDVCACGVRNMTVVVDSSSYNANLNPVFDFKNNDTDWGWWNGATSDVIMQGNSAAIITWTNENDPNYYDSAVELVFNLQAAGTDGQYLDFEFGETPIQRGAEWSSVGQPVLNGSVEGNYAAEADTNAGYGSYVATVIRVGTSVTVTVEFTANGSNEVTWKYTGTATNCPETDIALRISKNPAPLSNFNAWCGSLEAVVTE
ncbi:MAG TPA: InlB B-repeat-containing protein [Firmicutes bacterium]|nr:InlB B-repeat-containing protein [Bacillota bacterium]